MHEEGKSMLFICMCVHEDMKKIPARPLLIDYGLAGMRLMASTSPFLPLRPPFLVLTQEKEAKESQAPNRGRGSWPEAPGVPAKFAGHLNSTNKHLINSTFFTFRFSLLRWLDRGGRRPARLC